MAPTNVKAGFDVNSKEARLSWKSSLTDIEGFRVSRNNKYITAVYFKLLSISKDMAQNVSGNY